MKTMRQRYEEWLTEYTRNGRPEPADGYDTWAAGYLTRKKEETASEVA